MAESETKSTRVGCRSREWFLLVTDPARSDLLPRLSFAARRVTSVTLIVRRYSCGNGERRRAPAAARVAGCAAIRGPGRAVHVLSMVEFDAEAFIKLRGKSFQWRV